MKTGKTPFSPMLWMLILTLLLLGRPSQTQKPLTRAEDSPGFGLLEQARQWKSEGEYSRGVNKALEAGRVFQQENSWKLWGESYEEAYQCALKSNSNALYRTLLQELVTASQLLPGLQDVPASTQATIWSRLGRIQHYFGAYDLAAPLYEKSMTYVEEVGDTIQLIKLYANTAVAIWALGDDYRALPYFDKSLTLATIKNDSFLMSYILSSLGNVWRYVDPPKAVDLYLQSLNLYPKSSETLMLLSKAYLENGLQLTEALETAKKSWQFAVTKEEKSDALHQLGRVYTGYNDHRQALSYYNQALSYAVPGYGKSHPECAKIHVFKGHALLALGQWQEALAAYNTTLQDMLPLFTPEKADDNPSAAEITTTSLWILEALMGKVRTYDKMHAKQPQQQALVRSLACAELALDYQNTIKLRYRDDESKFALSSYFNSTCAAALHAALQLYQITGTPTYAQKAFRISEQTKAVVLAEALYKKELKQVANVPPELLDLERQSQEQIAYFEKKLGAAENAVQVQSIKDSLFQAQRQLETREQQIRDDYPAFGEALFSYRTDISIDSVQRSLPDDTALLEYFLGDSALYTFLLTKDTFWVQEQALPASFDQAASGLLHSVNNWRFVADSSAVASRLFLDNSRLLYEWLLEKPLAVTQAKRLFIIPDGKLSLLPFELLLTRPYAGQWIDRDVPFLMKERAVSYRFSARGQASKAVAPEEGWGGFGLEYNDGSLSATDNQGAGQGLRDFGPLPFADDEVKAISSVLGGAFWLNRDATRENFLKNAERHGILHLAMHGIVDERNPLRSRLLFSSSIAGSDPFVYASDLYNLQLKAGLSVLSACQSGTGAWKKGEGVLSLARAFAFAGCPSMVMSLWNVSDQSTSDLMVTFYEQLKLGATKDEALRAAKLHYLRTASAEYTKPIYWAAFVPIGEMDSLPDPYFTQEKGWMTLLFWAALIVLLAGLGIIFYRRQKLIDG